MSHAAAGRVIAVIVHDALANGPVPMSGPHRHPQQRDDQPDAADDYQDDANGVDVESVRRDVNREAKDRPDGYEK